MKMRYLALAALLALPVGQASADVIPRGEPAFGAERHPASKPVSNHYGGHWGSRGGWGGWFGGWHGSWGGGWGGHHGQGCRKVKSFVKFKRHPRWGYWLYRVEWKEVCPSPH